MKYLLLSFIMAIFSLATSAQTTPCDSITIPDIFTPNHDGFNDSFVIDCIASFPQNQITIFDRQGQQVYYASGYDNNWQGTWEQTNGDIPDGAYIYILTVTMNGTEKIFKGTISIHR